MMVDHMQLIGAFIVTSRPGVHHIPGPLHHRSTILSALVPTTLSRFCFWELTRELPSGPPIMGVLSCATRLTSEFRWNPKPSFGGHKESNGVLT
ncbi:hypothetical protein DVH24_036014 [Malus domestica]|uniref:Uncharacterized protein n=1 Tax=Malus domestica TaxID=3750 RepID=A0A498JQM5_MALDO|nr:hypothetical protein DVH24_036014 [Malus domestica]